MAKHILWIHGWGASSEVWKEAPAFITEWNHHFADFSSCQTIADFYNEIQEKLSAHQQGWVIIGWSMGALLALETWLDNSRTQQHQIEALVLVSATLRFVHSDRSKGWPQRIVERMRKQLLLEPEQVLSQFKQSMLSPKEQEENENQMALQALINTGFSLAGLQAGLTYLIETDLSSQWDRLAEQGQLSRLLWIHGKEDTICPIGAIPDFMERPAVQIAHAGHIPFLTAKELFYTQLRSFLNEHQ